MDSETRQLTGEPARAPSAGAPVPEVPAALLGPGPGTPTTYLPPVTPAMTAGNGAPAAYQGTTYAAPPAGAPRANGGPAPAGPSSGPAWGPAPGGPFAGVAGQRNAWIPLALIVIGLLALTGRFHDVFGAAIPLALGLVFLYVSTQGPHRWGFRIPGAILTGLGAGIVVDSMDLGAGGGWSAVGLGLGFIALWAWERAQWWWLIPGAVVTLGGLEGVMASNGLGTSLIFPVALIALGAYLLSGRRWRTR